ncbi:MAG: GntR family transcriptional regulator [Lacunisphaera sp.]
MIEAKHRAVPIRVRSAGIYLQLKDMILNGQLNPGQRLVERELAKQLKVSRIPLRETLIRLESEGLVRSVANTATFVEDFSPQDLMEIYSLRLVLEPLAAHLAALRTTAELVRSLRQICDRMTRYSESGEIKKLDQADYDFHRTIVEASQHRRLIRAYDISQIRVLSKGGSMTKLKAQPPDFTAQEHLPIVDCIERGDAVGAEKANHQHVHTAMQGFRKFHGFIVQQQRSSVTD